MNKRRYVGLCLKFIVSVALIWFLLDGVGVGQAFARLSNVNLGWLALAAGIAMLQVLICTFRWRAVLNGIGVYLSFQKSFVYWYISAFFNQALPSNSGGDAVRGYLAYKDGLGLAPVLSSLFLDRAATVLALVVLVASMTPFVTNDLENGRWFVRVVWVLLGVCVMGLALVMVLDKTPASWARFRVVNALHYLAVDCRRVFLNVLTASLLMMWSVLAHVNLVLVIYVLFLAIGNPVPLVDCLLLFPPVLLAQVVPVSIAGWGVREGAMVSMFALVGVPADAALAVSILYGLVLIVTSFPGAVIWLASGTRIAPKEVEKFAETTNN